MKLEGRLVSRRATDCPAVDNAVRPFALQKVDQPLTQERRRCDTCRPQNRDPDFGTERALVASWKLDALIRAST